MKTNVLTSVDESLTYQEKGELMESEDAKRSGKGIVSFKERPDERFESCSA